MPWHPLQTMGALARPVTAPKSVTPRFNGLFELAPLLGTADVVPMFLAGGAFCRLTAANTPPFHRPG